MGESARVSMRVTPPPGTVTEFVTEQIRDRIVLGHLRPGDRLPVYSLAEELGVSRVPLREAVRQLEAESLVDNLPRRGTVVRALSARDIYEAFIMLRRIEDIAATQAAETGMNVSVPEMRRCLDEMATLIDSGVDTASLDLLHAHRAFHFAMFAATGRGGLLYRHLCMLWNTAERYVINSRTPERLGAAHCEHTNLMQQIENRDVEGTRRALIHHVEAAWEGTRAFLAENDIDLSEVPENLG